MTERDFVLNNYASMSVNYKDNLFTINLLKDLYKTICENTSEESDTIKEIEAIMEFIGFGGLNDIAQMRVKRDLFELKNKIQKMV